MMICSDCNGDLIMLELTCDADSERRSSSSHMPTAETSSTGAVVFGLQLSVAELETPAR